MCHSDSMQSYSCNVRLFLKLRNHLFLVIAWPISMSFNEYIEISTFAKIKPTATFN